VSHTSPRPPPDDRSSWRIYPRWEWFGHLVSPTNVPFEWKLEPRRRCGIPPPFGSRWPTFRAQGAERLRVAHRSSSRNGDRGRSPEVPSTAESPVRAPFLQLFSWEWCACWAKRLCYQLPARPLTKAFLVVGSTTVCRASRPPERMLAPPSIAAAPSTASAFGCPRL
jgi:hypothetical protein